MSNRMNRIMNNVFTTPPKNTVNRATNTYKKERITTGGTARNDGLNASRSLEEIPVEFKPCDLTCQVLPETLYHSVS